MRAYHSCQCSSATHAWCSTCDSIRQTRVEYLPTRRGALADMTIYEGARLLCGACESVLAVLYRKKEEPTRPYGRADEAKWYAEQRAKERAEQLEQEREWREKGWTGPGKPYESRRQKNPDAHYRLNKIGRGVR